MNTKRIFFILFVLLSLVLTACGGAQAALPSTPPQGSWSGLTGDPDHATYSVNMTFANCSPNVECAAISYVDENWTCSGTLTYTGTDSGQYLFAEKLINSTGGIDCVSGLIKVQPQTDGTWVWGWYFAPNETEAAGTAVLREIK